jgi:hypothetical protein
MDHLSKSTQKVNNMFRTFLSLPRFWQNNPLGPTESPSMFDSARFEQPQAIMFPRSTTPSSYKQPKVTQWENQACSISTPS